MAVKQSATWSPGVAGKTNKSDKGVDDRLPTEKELAKAGEVDVSDKESQTRKFSSLLKAHEGVQHKYLVVFIRHFFCGICQEYIRRLSSDLPPSSLPADTSIVIVGCGQPQHLERYSAETETAYLIYADPSKKLHDILRMTRTLDLGPQTPQYLSHTSMSKITLRSIWQELKSGRQMLTGGNYSQVGGEFLFDVSATGVVSPVWCKRMRNTRDHAELSEIKRVLGMNANKMDEDNSDSSSPPPSSQPEIAETTTASPSVPAEKKKRWSSISGATGGIGRKLSKRGRTTSWQAGSSGNKSNIQEPKINGVVEEEPIASSSTPLEHFKTAQTQGSASSKEAEQEREVLEQLREEPENTKTEDRNDALAKLTGASQPPVAANSKSETQLNPNDTTGEPSQTNGVPVEGAKIAVPDNDILLNGVAAVKEEKKSALIPDITAYQKESSPEPQLAPAVKI